jgi:hypothetical protein
MAAHRVDHAWIWTLAICTAFVLLGCPKTEHAPGAVPDSGATAVANKHDAGHGSGGVTAGASGAPGSGGASSSAGAGGSLSHADAGGSHDAGQPCPGFQHVCACATGSYCLAGNAACITPSSPCPVHKDAGAADAGPHCGALQHACACATGSYCLAAGAACIAPSAPCP